MLSETGRPALVLRAKPIWRYGLGLFVLFALGGAIGQQLWEEARNVLVFVPLAAYAWWARVEVTDTTITVRRLQTSTLSLDALTGAERVFTGGRMPYRAFELRTEDQRQRLWFAWWDGWRTLAARLVERGFTDLERYAR